MVKISVNLNRFIAFIIVCSLWWFGTFLLKPNTLRQHSDDEEKWSHVPCCSHLVSCPSSASSFCSAWVNATSMLLCIPESWFGGGVGKWLPMLLCPPCGTMPAYHVVSAHGRAVWVTIMELLDHWSWKSLLRSSSPSVKWTRIEVSSSSAEGPMQHHLGPSLLSRTHGFFEIVFSNCLLHSVYKLGRYLISNFMKLFLHLH